MSARPLLGILLCVATMVLAPAAWAGPVETYGMVFVCDGAKGDVFYDYAMNPPGGKPLLPNVKKYFIDGGAWVRQATGVFPTITGAGMPAVLTGCYPGRADMPSLYFFSRKDKKYPVLYVLAEAFDWNRWLSPKVKTIWEHFPGPDDAISFGPALYRGADRHIPILWNFKYKPMEFRAKLTEEMRKLKRATLGGTPARMTVVYNGWFDHLEHGNGARSPAQIEEYANVDRQVGAAMEEFLSMVEGRKKLGADVRYYAALVSDHGHQDIKKVIGIDDYIRKQKGARVLDKVWRRLFGFKLKGDIPTDFSPYDLVVASGEGHALLYFPDFKEGAPGTPAVKDWDNRPRLQLMRSYPYKNERIDLIATAVQSPAVNFLVAKDFEKDIVHVYSKAGEATIERRQEPAGTFYRYRVVTGEDPLSFASGEATGGLVGDEFHSGRQWQLATLETEYPDAPVMLFQVFDSKDRAADLFLSAAPYISIGDLVDGDKSKSKHGGLTKDEAWATLAFHGSGIEPGLVPTARNVDMVPTLLTLMGHDYDPSALDGEAVPEVVERVNESFGSRMPREQVSAQRRVARALVAELSNAPDAALPGLAGALQTVLARPGMPASEVRAFRSRAYGALARRRSNAAWAVLRGESENEFLSRPRPDLTGAAASGGTKPAAEPAVLAMMSAEVARAAMVRIFEDLAVMFAKVTAPTSETGKETLARIDAHIAALVALHDAGYPVPAPKFSFDTRRDGVNLWFEGVETTSTASSGTVKALSEYVRIETARASGPIRSTFFDKERADVQVAVGKRLQGLVAALAKRPSGEKVDAGALARKLPPGHTSALLTSLGAYARATTLPGEASRTGTRDFSGTTRGAGELDGLYRDMGAR